MRSSALLFGALLLACGEPSSPEAAGVQDLEEVALPRTTTFANVTMRLPDLWEVTDSELDPASSGDEVLVGIPAGGDLDIPLRVMTRYAKDIDSLAPTDCPLEGDPAIGIKSVTAVESGLKPIGDKKAHFRRFRVVCEDDSVQEHRAWLLPISKIAIYEQRVSAENEAVVTAMQVDKLEDVAFDNVTFHVHPSWELARDGDVAHLGLLAGGPDDVAFELRAGFTGAIEDLAPTSCPVEGDPPMAVTETRVLDQGRTPMDGAEAEFRRFVVTCADGHFEARRAWVLPTAKIAIVEKKASPDTRQVIRHATVR